MLNGLYLGGGSASSSCGVRRAGVRAPDTVQRRPATTLTTALTSGVGSTTSLHVSALPAALPAGIVQVWNASSNVQNFVTTGAAVSATTIPITAQTANATYPIGSNVNGFGYSGDSTNALVMEGCHWENNLSGAIWMTGGVNNANGALQVYIIGSKIEQDLIGFNCPALQVDGGCGDIQVKDLYAYAGGFNGAFSTPITLISWQPNYGSLTDVFMSNTGGLSTTSTGIVVNPGSNTQLANIFQFWSTVPTVSCISFTGGATQISNINFGGALPATPIVVSGGATYGTSLTGQPSQQQSATVQTVAAGNTITTANLGTARVTATAARATLVLQAGTTAGQQVTVINESAFALTFDVQATSHVADGATLAIPALAARSFTWDSGTSLWYRSA